MLPIYLYKKMMLEKKASSDQDYIKLAKLMEKLANPIPAPDWSGALQGIYASVTPSQQRVNPNSIRAVTNPFIERIAIAAAQSGMNPDGIRAVTNPFIERIAIAAAQSASQPAAQSASQPAVQSATKPATFLEKVKGTWSNLKARGADLLSKLKGGGGRLRALLGLGSLIAGYSALNMAEPYFVRRLRESAYGGQYTTPVTDLLGAAKGPNADEEANKFFEAVRQRFNRLQQGGYAPGVFDPVTGSFNDYRNKSTIFSPIWNALRYLNIFDSHTAPVYEKHYRTPEEFVNSLEQYANRLRQEINEDAIRMEPHEHRKAMNYLNQLQERIRNYRRELNRGGIVGYSGIL